MARDGNGTFDLAEAAFVNGSTIDADAMNSNLSDIAAGLTQSLSKDGQTTPTGNLPMGSFKHTGVADGSARTDYASLGQVAKGTLFYIADTGAADAYVVAPSPGIAANVVGFKVRWKVANANLTTTPTLAANSLTAGTIVWPDGSALAAGDLPANAIVETVIASLSGSTPTWHLMTVAKAAGIVPKTLLDAKGDLIAATADNTPARLAAGSNGAILMARSAATAGLAYVSALTGTIHGLTYQNNGSDATNDIDIAAGGCMDSTGAYWLTLSALTKRLDASWAVGTNQGGLDTGSIADADYYIWAIARSDTGVTDILFSTSASSPTMPANYDYKRLIGWFKRVGGSIVAFHTYEISGGGIEMAWDSPTVDVAAATVGTSRSLQAVKVPSGLSVMAHLSVTLSFSGGEARHLNVSCPDQTDSTVNVTTAVQGTAGFTQTVSLTAGAQSVSDNTGTITWRQQARTNTSAQVAMKASGASATVNASTISFEWSRR